MNKVLTIMLLVFMIGITGAMADIDFTGWKKIEVNESQVNASSTTTYSVMIPPGITEATQDSGVGPATILTNTTDPSTSYAIYVMDNPFGKQLSNETAKLFLNSFMEGAGITPLEQDPVTVSDGVMMYGTKGDTTAGIYVFSTDQKVSITSGFYKTMDDASAGVQNLAMIAGTIIINPVAS
nr:hypothetical protein [uncultured Methanospirillum sp.]